MPKIIYLQDYKNHKKGEIEIVSSNRAQNSVKSGVASFYARNPVKMLWGAIKDRMMRPKKGTKEKPEEKLKKGQYLTK